MTFGDGHVRRDEEGAKVAARHPVSVVGKPAAHRVEEGVREVPPGGALVPGGLEAVDRADDADQVPGSVLDVGAHGVGEPGRREFTHERPDLDRVAVDIRDDEPSPRGTGVEGDGGAQEERASLAPDVVLRLDGGARAEAIELCVREENLRAVEAGGPGDVDAERLAWLGLVARYGTQAKQRERQPRDPLRALVAVDEGAVLHLEALPHARGQNVVDAVQHLNLDRAGARVLDLGGSHEPVAIARGPRVPERNAEVLVDLPRSARRCRTRSCRGCARPCTHRVRATRTAPRGASRIPDAPAAGSCSPSSPPRRGCGHLSCTGRARGRDSPVPPSDRRSSRGTTSGPSCSRPS